MTLTEIVEAMSKVNIVVIGDGIWDEYIFGRVERLCPEGPVPVFIPEREEQRKGGAMNVTEQLRALGVDATGFHGYPLSVKRRYMVGQHLMLRVDLDQQSKLSQESAIKVLGEKILGERKIDAIVLSDYAKGTLTPELCQYAIRFANDNGIPVVVDPKGTDWSKYEGADWLCPNQSELHAARGHSWPGSMLVKRGERGLLVSGLLDVELPAQAKRVFDVTGAGDTVTAVFAAALAVKAEPVEAAMLANLAAGYVVGEIGTTICPKDALLGLLK